MPDRCNCECHQPDMGMMHIIACCRTCSNCGESRIIQVDHTCPPTHLGQRVQDGVELACQQGQVIPAWETSKDLPRKICRVPQEDAASIFFTFKPDKVTCEDCR